MKKILFIIISLAFFIVSIILFFYKELNLSIIFNSIGFTVILINSLIEIKKKDKDDF